MKTLAHLSRFGRHDDTCPLLCEANLPGDSRCTCGFSLALQNSEVVAVIELCEAAIEFQRVLNTKQGDDAFSFTAWSAANDRLEAATKQYVAVAS